MCGIAGIYNFNLNQIEINEIDLITDALTHRGPDGRGIRYNENKSVALGHRRLSILDLSDSASQPMAFEEERYWIVFNGEIFNFIEIRTELNNKGYQFKTESDTEVVLAAYHHWGEDCLNKFNGMWAFAIYDQQDHSLILSRDRYGVKPLYYYFDEEIFYFASEVQAIHKVLGKQHPLNEKVISETARGSFNSHGTNLTYLESVYSLTGGHNLFIKNKKISVNVWYELKKISVPTNFDEQAVQLRNLIIDACNIRMRSDVPVATCLSGGLDSGTITSIISKFGDTSNSRFNNYTHKGFCASFPNTVIDESKDAVRLAKQLNTKIDVLEIKAPKKEELIEAMKACDGPMHALAFYPIWSLYKHIRENNIKVTLDGQGPDEMLGGYRPILDALDAAIELKKPRWFLNVYDTYSSMGETKQFSSKKFARKQLLLIILKRIIPKFILNRIVPEQKINAPFWITNKFDKSLYHQFFYSPLPGILQQYDRCSMANGVECRMPFMDYRIVEFLFSLPVESKVGDGYTKRILREATKGILPDETRLNKLKIGFNAPIVDWFKGNLKDFMLEIINSNEFLESKYFDGKKLNYDFLDFLNKKKPLWDDAWKFWPPVHLTWWLNNLKTS